MGSRCSACRRDKTKEKEPHKVDQEKAEDSTTVEHGEQSALLQTRSSPQEEGGAATDTIEKTLSRQEEENTDTASETLGCSEKSSTLLHEATLAEVNTSSPGLSETHDHDSAITEGNAAWVDDNRATLIQSVSSVMVIADEMLQQKLIEKETYARIKDAGISQEQMREIYSTLTTTKAKSAFFRILQDKLPQHCQTEDLVREVKKKHKAVLREKFRYEFEGTQTDHEDVRSLDKIYTELHIIKGLSDHVNQEHEIWAIEDKMRSQTSEGTKINCNDIFTRTTENSVSSGRDGDVKAIRTVMTKGIAGIGKTVSVKKFILDWADGTANQDLDFIFVLPFRELNLVMKKQFRLETLVREFHPELKNIPVANTFANHKVLFVFDGLDESQLKLNFKTTERLTDTTEDASVDTLVTNLIREHLLPSALVWITSRPGAVQRIPRKYIQQWTEVKGFNDPQKIQYFRKRVEDEAVAEMIIDNIVRSRSLYIMCHIPIFCWIAVKVLVSLLQKKAKTHDENIKIPTTLTEMYTRFLSIQMQVEMDKYDNQNEIDTEEIFKSSEEFILKLGRMAFEHLNRGNIIFTGDDLKSYGLDVRKAGVCCGLCTEILKEEYVFNTRKLFCFVHLTVQEYFAALFVYHSFARKQIDSLSLKDFLLTGSEEELKAELDADPVDLPLDELIEISVANSIERKAGELDMFIRFLIGVSLKSTQDLLQGLIQQKDDHSAVVEAVKKSLKEIDLGDCSPDRCLNVVHCLMELKDSSIHDTVEQFLNPDHNPDTRLTPVQCSALADSILMSKTPLDEFHLKTYRPAAKGVFRLLPAVRNSKKARISGVWLDVWYCETISAALRMPNSPLTELHLINSVFVPSGTQVLIDGLMNCQCELQALSLSGHGYGGELLESFVTAIKSILSNLRDLELSGNILGGALSSVFSDGLGNLEKLRLNRNSGIAQTCKELVTMLISKPCYLRELELSYTNFEDSEMEILCTGLMSTNCNLAVLSLSHNRLTEKGCKLLASALSSKPSCLTELDLSYNDLLDSGVAELCNALMSPQCRLKMLRLSFCKVTGDGCVALASALRSDHCSLRELDLSFNHLSDQGVKMLTEIQRDPRCRLEKLNVDQNEEFWFDLKLLRKYACELTLNPDTAGEYVILSEENKKATYVTEKQPHPDNPERFDCRQVLCEEGLTGRHYWEAEDFSADGVGVAYKSMDRVGDCSGEFSLGENEKSWCWSLDGSFHHNGSCMTFIDDTHRSTIGVYLDWPAGILSFFEVFPDRLKHLYTVRTTFTEPLHPGFHVGDGSVRICKIN
ncbi:NACHT, LRR and PYD domains-containing protein 3-like isoform X2 [Acanthopagrus latus]|uniref:NACHT, LRR and PYD domains-containing protein 3-like isoform X2 n=1 Tax=Acanthopagrus latus TaxID=8177 RepID=UPI00187C10FE|nr:NACHT, LRR and PYD domains-containing protein 3-like isoform X2 [Acanthopagrus latus]